MYDYICKECGKSFSSKNKNDLSNLVLCHIRKDHNMSALAYRLKWDLIKPSCFVKGCCNTPTLRKGLFSDWYKFCPDHIKDAQHYNMEFLSNNNEEMLKAQKKSGINLAEFNKTPFKDRDKEYQIRFKKARSEAMTRQNKDWWKDPDYRKAKIEQSKKYWSNPENRDKARSINKILHTTVKHRFILNLNYFKKGIEQGKDLCLYLVLSGNSLKLGLTLDLPTRLKQIFYVGKIDKVYKIGSNLDNLTKCKLEPILLLRSRKYKQDDLSLCKIKNSTEYRKIECLQSIFSTLKKYNILIEEIRYG